MKRSTDDGVGSATSTAGGRVPLPALPLVARLLALLLSVLPLKALSDELTFQQVAAGANHTVALKSNGTLWTWGDNYYGQLGNGTMANKSSPAQVGTATNWQAVAAGSSHTVALRSDGTLWAWGWNEFGQLGNGTDGTFAREFSPVQVGTATNWQAVAAGWYHTVALKSDGTLWAWGQNDYCQLGDGTTANKSSPVQVGTATNWQAVAAGQCHTVALKSDGTLWAWGYNRYGAVGRSQHHQPIQPGAGRHGQQLAGGGGGTIPHGGAQERRHALGLGPQ